MSVCKASWYIYVGLYAEHVCQSVRRTSIFYIYIMSVCKASWYICRSVRRAAIYMIHDSKASKYVLQCIPIRQSVRANSLGHQAASASNIRVQKPKGYH